MTRAGSLARVSPALAGPVIVEGGTMKSLRIVALAAFLVFSTAVALADSIPPGDPVIRTGGGSGSAPIYSPIFTILTATGASPTDGTPCILMQGGNSAAEQDCVFRNDIQTEENTIHKLIFSAKTYFSGALTCALSTALGGQSPWFTECLATGSQVKFFGGPGIPFGGDFSFGFRGFNPNATFRVIAITERDDSPTTVPEPGTLALLGGVAALLVRRRSHAC